jgi:hypothetical protein
MEKEGVYDCGDMHKSHLCQIRAHGGSKEGNWLTKHPNVSCVNCGEEASSNDNVCLPIPLFI